VNAAERAVPGIDTEPVSAWLAANVAGVVPPFAFELITGGRSNLTYSVKDAGAQHVVLRRPPLGSLLATAHDVVREFRIVAALAPTAVPVPPPLGVCDDASVNGTPFAVTGFVDGKVLDTADKAAAIGTGARRDLAFHLVDVLADLHAVRLDEVGLADLARHDSYIERQLKRWTRQWTDSKTRELSTIDEVASKLADGMPEQHGAAIVHGDYRFGNCISDIDNRRIAAVLDWELCTLGDPMADLGHLSVYWHDPARPLALANDPTSAGGFPGYDELLQRYAIRTGRDVGSIEYYRAFAAWRLAIIGEGVASRHLARHPEDAAALAASQTAVGQLAESALESLR
jgi:aminoglycoside phosphotransferase (APT) family kinase protein